MKNTEKLEFELFKKLTYITTIINSCQKIEHVDVSFKWGKDIILKYIDFYRNQTDISYFKCLDVQNKFIDFLINNRLRRIEKIKIS